MIQKNKKDQSKSWNFWFWKKPELPEGLPTADEINSTNTPEGKKAAKLFLGRTVDQIIKKLHKDEQKYFEAYFEMGPTAFNYYFPAVEKYLEETNYSDLTIPMTISMLFDGILLSDEEKGEFRPSYPAMLRISTTLYQLWEQSHFDDDFSNEFRGWMVSDFSTLKDQLRELIETDKNGSGTE